MTPVTWSYDENTKILNVFDGTRNVGTYNAPKKRDVIHVLRDLFNVPIFQRKLAANHAHNCENAKCDVCKCRCGGQLHGHDHKLFQELEAELFKRKKAANEFVLRDDIEEAIQQAIQIMKGATV